EGVVHPGDLLDAAHGAEGTANRLLGRVALLGGRHDGGAGWIASGRLKDRPDRKRDAAAVRLGRDPGPARNALSARERLLAALVGRALSVAGEAVAESGVRIADRPGRADRVAPSRGTVGRRGSKSQGGGGGGA